jgi:lysine 2,3-aminomutase
MSIGITETTCKTSHTAYITKIGQVKELTPEERQRLGKVSDQFAFRSNSYYQSLINWDDPLDPIRRIIMPDTDELLDWGMLDASSECSYTVAPGVEHKYPATALLLVTDVCGGYCRFCFRKRLFMPDNDEKLKDVTAGVNYIREHPEITNVLLTGGDPLMLSTRRLSEILLELSTIEHLSIIRIGSKMPAFNPARITKDEALLEMVRTFSEHRGIYVIAHFNHPRELTAEAIESLHKLRLAGAITANQTPVIKGVNDDPKVLARLFTELAAAGTPPYYVFQCRPTLGNAPYSVPIEEAFSVFAKAQSSCSGLAKRARFVMSHVTGKVEIVGLSGGHTYLRYHEAVNPLDMNRLLVLRSNPRAGWLDDYEEIRTTNSSIEPSTSQGAFLPQAHLKPTEIARVGSRR